MNADKLLKGAEAIEGMTSPTSMYIFHAFLQAQKMSGSMLEIGAYKGKSAYILAGSVREGETLYAMDPENRIDWPAFGPLASKVTFLEGYSDKLETLLPNYSALRGTLRFVHDDAAHTFANVLENLLHADRLLAPQGLLAVDDYENPNYPQVPLAVGAAIFKHDCNFRPVLVANNKAYYCRSEFWRTTMEFVRFTLAPQVREAFGLSLARTDGEEFSPYALRLPNVSDEEGLYAPKLYGHFLTGWLD